MGIIDSRRLNIVMPYLYPDLSCSMIDGDYRLRNDSDGKGSYVVWKNDKITPPTDQEIADAKEEAINDYWWEQLRRIRNKLLVDSDWSQGADVPSAVKSSYVTYRTDLRDLPTTVTKPDFATLNGQGVNEWISHIDSLMPTKPGA